MNNVERQKLIYEKLMKLEGVKQLLALNTVNTLYEVQLSEEKQSNKKDIV